MNPKLLHAIVADIKRVARDLNRVPSEQDYLIEGVFSKENYIDWNDVLKKSGLQNPVKITLPKILLFDIETAPILAHVWGLWENNVGLNQIVSDWHVLSWAAKWLDPSDQEEPSKIFYMDQRHAKNIEDDKDILGGIWELLDEADIVITQNGKNFDHKKLNARFLINKFQPPSSYRHIDTKILAKRHFGLTSNKLEYMTDKINTKYKKLKHEQFVGHELWSQCLKGNIKAWEEMEKYNKHDVLALEELYHHMIPWDNSINFNTYHDSFVTVCKCGSTSIMKNGYNFTNLGRYQRFRCAKCGSEVAGRTNELSKEKIKSLKKHTQR